MLVEFYKIMTLSLLSLLNLKAGVLMDGFRCSYSSFIRVFTVGYLDSVMLL